MSSSYFESLMNLKKVSDEPLVFQNLKPLEKMGNVLPIAYGGLLQAHSLMAAFHSLPGESQDKDKWVVYSVTGHFLGPTTLAYPAEYRVERLRDTRTFATRSIVVSQQDAKGSKRNTLSTTIDFTLRIAQDDNVEHGMARLPLEFSAKPSREYPNPESVPHIIDYAAEQVKAGHFDKKTFKLLSETFQLVSRVSKLRLMQDQPFSRTLMGFNIGPHNSNQLANDFAGKDVTSTRQSDWIKSNEPIKAVDASDDGVLPLSRYIVQAAFLLFIGDEALSILPLILHGLSMMDASAASTLDYSIRFLSDDFDFEQYHLRETRTIAAKHQRTYSEALIWDTSNRLVAVISQTCVARPKPNSASKM